VSVEFPLWEKAQRLCGGGEKDRKYVPPLINILTPGGRASMPALMASKHCSSGTGSFFQLQQTSAQIDEEEKTLRTSSTSSHAVECVRIHSVHNAVATYSDFTNDDPRGGSTKTGSSTGHCDTNFRVNRFVEDVGCPIDLRADIAIRDHDCRKATTARQMAKG